MVDRIAGLKAAVRGRSRGRLDLLAFALSPDEHWAVTLLRVRATGYWLESLYEYGDEGWVEHSTSNGELAYTGISEDDEGTPVGVLRLYGRASADSQTVLIEWRGRVHEVPVQEGHFAFAAWNASENEEHNPELRGFR